MNKLIIIGNGFDLAHGLKTAYNDFIIWYLYTSINFAADLNEKIEDSFLSVKRVGTGHIRPYDGLYSNLYGMIEYFYCQGRIMELFSNKEVVVTSGDFQFLYFPFEVKVRDTLFRTLLNTACDQRWVDVELTYYQQLKRLLRIDGAPEHVQKMIHNLNNQLEYLTHLLQKYLLSLPDPKPLSKIQYLLYQAISYDDILDSVRDDGLYPQMRIKILNFNYTKTVEQYLYERKYRDIDVSLNYIHGQLNNNRNPLVFGFGDELDADYSRMEESSMKGFFKHAKSFAYLRTQNYRDLLRFIQAGNFQIYIWGHSCGLSDRTLLNTLFEHDNCKSIKLFYHRLDEKSDNFSELTEEISRHFKDKVKMRNRVVDKTLSEPMSQSTSEL